jgi:hypothetical protein
MKNIQVRRGKRDFRVLSGTEARGRKKRAEEGRICGLPQIFFGLFERGIHFCRQLSEIDVSKVVQTLQRLSKIQTELAAIFTGEDGRHIRIQRHSLPGESRSPAPLQHSIGTDANLQPGSNATVESALHPLKQFSQTLSTDAGMQIDESDEHSENANGPIRESFESASNVTLQSPRHNRKQRLPSISSGGESGHISH